LPATSKKIKNLRKYSKLGMLLKIPSTNIKTGKYAKQKKKKKVTNVKK
jgi:hypothetical protein